ncbi:MAG: Fic family protein [Saprospiraceae bacterium]|nr:Fic family protein [Saprospiraceae bacterium]
MITLESYRSGQILKSPSGYAYFLPTKVNDQWIWEDQEINVSIEQAAIKLGELNAYSRLVPDLRLFIQLYVTKEAVISSRIEGTRTQMDEALMDVEDISPERRNDWKEVNNYILALQHAITHLDQLPLSSRLLRHTDELLMEGARGEHKLPGQFRTSQNWIGGNSLANATFIPPHPDHVQDLMGDLENFIHNEEIQMSDLVKIAIAHYQFETIHPFLDGNGRIGRLLITLFLVEKKILTSPLLYLSSYFEHNKGLYYDNLTAVRTRHDMKQWLIYFLEGIVETAEKSSQILIRILDLQKRLETSIHQEFGRRSQQGLVLLRGLFEKPIVSVNQVKDMTGLSYNAANSLVQEFVQAGYLKEMTGYDRNRVFVFEEYLREFD